MIDTDEECVNLPGGERARVGIATFDSAVQFYALRPGQSAPQMLVVPDILEPYAPSASSLLVDAQKARSLVSARAIVAFMH
jgi:protein transport protein SEC24